MGAGGLRIVEKGGDVGGTWYWNRYPGAMCDVESYSYMPLLEEMNYVPLDKYAKSPEILQHAKNIAAKHNLTEAAVFQTVVTGCVWEEGDLRWSVETDRGDHFRARFIVLANGILTTPKVPQIPGIETFGGHAFHTSRW